MRIENFETISVENRDEVVVLTLNRPERANSINQKMRLEILEVLQNIRDDGSRILIITGAGRHFCGGADLKAARAGEGPVAADFIDAVQALPIPVIAAINGACTGGGMELALACDFRVAAEGVELGLPEIRFGGLPAGGGTQRAPRIAGPAVAKELLMFGLPFKAEEALTKGLVNRVVPASRLMAEVEEMAQVLKTRPAFALAMAKRVVDEGLDLPLQQGLELEHQLVFSITPEMLREAQDAAASAEPVYAKIFK